ncbi:14755_t:CDS:2, partial [Entrophospora sp. SA101]
NVTFHKQIIRIRNIESHVNFLRKGIMQHKEIEDKKDTEFTQQLQEVETYNQNLPQEVRYPKYEIHPQAIYTSRLINTQQITQLLKCGSQD